MGRSVYKTIKHLTYSADSYFPHSIQFTLFSFSMKNAMGILGGTFDPIHNGHLHLAIETQKALDIEEIRLIPVQQPPHRQTPHASPKQRLNMIELAIADLKGIVADDRELQREGISYTIDTVKSLRNEFEQIPIALIIGMDAFQTLNSWRDWSSILDYVHIIIADRPGNPAHLSNLELEDFYLQYRSENHSDALQMPAGQILKFDIPMMDISSTQIRYRLSNNLDARNTLPTKVIDYIHEESLYH